MTPSTRAAGRTGGGDGAGARPIQIVVTPGSGNGRALAAARRLGEGLRARGHAVALEAFADLVRLRRWAAAAAPRFSLLVAVGGDGTQSTAAAAALRRSVPFLAVPSGFGNLFARAFGHGPDVDRAVELVERGELVAADVGLRNGQAFLDQESFGMLAGIQASVEARFTRPRARWRRWAAYYRGALRYLRETRLTALRVTVDGRVLAHDAAVVTVANVATYGPWLPLTPAASPVDGLLDVFAMRGPTKRTVLARLLRHHLRLPGRAEGALLSRGRRVSVAGSPGAPDELELLPRRLPVVVSAETARRLEGRPAADAAVAEAGASRVA